MTQEALRMALDALEANDQLINGTGTNGGLLYCIDGYYSDCFDVDPINKQTEEAITAIKEALAQPEQEPRNVRERWNVELDGNDLLVCFNDHEKGDKCQYERYSPQRTWVGLAAEDRLTAKYMQDAPNGIEAVIDYIEAKLKELNG